MIQDNTLDNDDLLSPEEDNDSDITPEERALIDSSFEDEEEKELHAAELDSVDNDGELLEEQSSSTSAMGDDLDVPGAELDDENEELGEEDEENNSYSMGEND